MSKYITAQQVTKTLKKGVFQIGGGGQRRGGISYFSKPLMTQVVSYENINNMRLNVHILRKRKKRVLFCIIFMHN
jgi:hypothetical protein